MLKEKQLANITAIAVAELHRNSASGWNYKMTSYAMFDGFIVFCKRVGVVNNI